jgi:hypothetical protein
MVMFVVVREVAAAVMEEVLVVVEEVVVVVVVKTYLCEETSSWCISLGHNCEWQWQRDKGGFKGKKEGMKEV